MTATTSDRAEQAKALIDMVDARFAGAERINLTIGERIALDLAAALTASEAEVTRLETGITEALEALNQEDEVQQAWDILTALSQPTTDTNGAHA